MVSASLLGGALASQIAFDDDEFQHIHMAWLVARGEVPYRDFFEHHTPLYHLLLAPLTLGRPGPDRILVARGVSVGVFAALLGSLFWALTRWLPRPQGIGVSLAWVAVSPVFLVKMIEVRPDGLSALLGVIAFGLLAGAPAVLSPAGPGQPAEGQPGRPRGMGVLARLLKEGISDRAEPRCAAPIAGIPDSIRLRRQAGTPVPRPGPVRPLVAGLVAGAMVMATQKFVFLGIGLGAVALVLHGFRAAAKFSLGALVVPLVVVGWLGLVGAGPAAWESLVVMNLGWEESFSPAGYAGQFAAGSGPLIALGMAGIAWALTQPDARRPGWAALLLTAAGIAAVLLIPIPFRQTYLMLIPGLALGCTLGLGAVGALFHGPAAWTGGLALCLAGLLPGLAALRHEAAETLDADLARMRHVQATTRGPVFDGRGLVFWRPHVGRHAWFHQGLLLMLEPAEVSESTIQALRGAGFPPVLWDYRIDDLPDTITEFLHGHYLSVDPEPLWRPGVRIDRSRLVGAGTDILVPTPGWYRADWTGGAVLVNGVEATPGSILPLGPESVRISARGLVREFTLVRVGTTP